MILSLIEQIIQQTTAHCRVEEDMLRLMNHPSLKNQTETHKRIMDELAAFRDGIVGAKVGPLSEHWHLLDSLIVHHIRDEPCLCGWPTHSAHRTKTLDERYN
jgi:hemerythrin